MKITKKLKYADFEYDEASKLFTIIDTEHGGAVELNKVYSFAFMRFVIRMAQRNWLRNKKSLDNNTEIMLGSELDSKLNNEDQMDFFDKQEI